MISLDFVFPVTHCEQYVCELWFVYIYFVMELMSTEKRVFVIYTFNKHNDSPTASVRVLRVIIGLNFAPNESTVRRLICK